MTVEGLDDIPFQPAAGGWSFKLSHPLLLGQPRYYAVNAAQKAAIAAELGSIRAIRTAMVLPGAPARCAGCCRPAVAPVVLLGGCAPGLFVPLRPFCCGERFWLLAVTPAAGRSPARRRKHWPCPPVAKRGPAPAVSVSSSLLLRICLQPNSLGRDARTSQPPPTRRGRVCLWTGCAPLGSADRGKASGKAPGVRRPEPFTSAFLGFKKFEARRR